MIQMRKIYISIIFIMVLTIFSSISLMKVQARTNPFQDVPEDTWYYEPVLNLHSMQIIMGKTPLIFDPFAIATREQTALLFVRALGLENVQVKDAGFTDVSKTSPYYEAINILYEEHIISGYGNHQFGPKDPLTRAQIAKMIVLGFHLNISDNISTPFTDVNQLKDEETFRYIQTLVDDGITKGTSPTKYSPQKSINRAEIATFLYRAMLKSEDFQMIGIE